MVVFAVLQYALRCAPSMAVSVRMQGARGGTAKPSLVRHSRGACALEPQRMRARARSRRSLQRKIIFK